ncbi:MAG: hypothetical protein H6707_03460 [Deltaproteobacteria bacterium]|nr:hypothetical protein [Deltaproteobacteria bacterium]
MKTLRAAVPVLLICIAMLIGCETTEGADCDGANCSRDAGVRTDGAPVADSAQPPSGIVTFKNAGETATASFSAGNEAYVVVPYSVSTTAADAIDFTIKLTTKTSGTRSYSMRWGGFPARKTDPVWAKRIASRIAVERWTRGLRERAATMRMSPQSTVLSPVRRKFGHIAACASGLSADCGANEVCVKGQCTSEISGYNVTEFAPTTKAIDLTVERKGQSVAILVEKGKTVAKADLDGLLQAFQEVIALRDVALFGDPALKSGETRTSSDRNGDGMVWLVLSDTVAEKNSDAVGFFVGTDFADVKDSANSNEADVLYCVLPSSGTPLPKILPILAHEFQHLLNFATKVYRPKVNGGQGALEELWLDEGLSHFAEDAVGYGGDNVTLLDQELFPSFGDFSLFVNVKTGDTPGLRALALAFVRYLFEQKGGVSYLKEDPRPQDKGGATWLKALLASDKAGVDGITATYGDYKAAFNNWIAAVVLDGRDVTDFAAYNYAPLITDPLTGSAIGLVVRGTRKDASGSEITLQGPLEKKLNSGDNADTIPNGGAKFFALSGLTGEATIEVTTQESDFRFAVIKVSK